MVSVTPQQADGIQRTSELLRVLADPTRLRLLALLSAAELSVAELTAVTRLSQPRVSTHLARLRDSGLVRDRSLGRASLYSLDTDALPAEKRRLWTLVREATRDPLLEEDAQRLGELRRKGEGGWADSVAGQMERHYSPGRTWEAATRGLLGLARLGDVLDIASGDGALAELVAPRARSITCLDRSRRVIRAARRRLGRLGNVSFRVGDMQALPFRDAAFDQILMMSSLSYAAHPERAIREAARVLKPAGDLAAVTLKAHRHGAVARQYDHLQDGFHPEALRELLASAGFEVELCDVTSRERRPPHFEVITVYARRQRYGAVS
ncbi:MAG: metalloregulator ArsR/SmtB family transcription factor [Myxococcota bacterium]